MTFVPSEKHFVIFRFSSCLSFMWNSFSHFLYLSHGFQTYGDSFSCHIQLIRELLLNWSVILIQQCLQFAVFKFFRWFSTEKNLFSFFVSHIKIATFEFFKPLKALWFTKSMLTVSFDKHSMRFCSSFFQMVTENQCCPQSLAVVSRHKIRHVQRYYKLYCCMKLVLLWVENLCQMSEQGNGAIWRQLHWQLWPSIGKFRFHIYILGIYFATSKRGGKISWQISQTKAKKKKFFQNSSRRWVKIKCFAHVSNFENSITNVPAKEVNSEFAQTFPLSFSFLTPTMRNEFTGSFKCITSTHVWHAGIYLVDRLPRTRSTAIVANTDDHDRSGQFWVVFYIDEHSSGTYFDSYGLPLDSKFFLRLCRNFIIAGIWRRCKEYFLKFTDNTAMYFYILYVMVIILASFLICLPLIVNAMTDWSYSYFINFFFVVIIKK